MNERGHTLVELIVVMAIMAILASVSIPYLRAYAAEVHLLGAGRVFKGEFRQARSIAIAKGVQTALRFEIEGDAVHLATYVDGNFNGVRSAEIDRGVDKRIGPRRPLVTGASDVRVAINPGVRAMPPDTGILDPRDPIRFGRSNMLSFSPLGTATPGTFYLAGPWAQAGVRVTPGSARVRLMVFRGTRWVHQ